ncbi:mitochondrial ribosomal protein S25-domain-containing protein [Dimargaris cristalligena]|uniref:Small ribosomal subunit protein mS23 n=1 Tax=Dimargaris cristalligena TaxID=215637 RepID=A0A4P9ZMJ6_9FUNG|nr:mitochondrial ribosomal protein S25-domain-containing protein [Dimargaris cristalligena]|eukprot:RKP34507.1 mitochondrial ribosomal protein S25-domain-containing protein [Dimargaris cristalligena]
MRPRKLATRVRQQALDMVRGKIRSEIPLWFPVLTKVPPASFFIRPDQKPRSVRHHHLKTKPPKPPRIVFPEDQLRRRFFRDHPHELLRPKTMRETNANAPGGGNRTDWSQLQDPRYPGTVTGEHVIQHQHYLMTKRSLTEQEAYARVLEVFYRIRAREDLELQIAQDQAYHFGAQRFASDVEMNLRLEEKQLKKSDAIITEREAIRRMQSATSEKNFQNAEEIGN